MKRYIKVIVLALLIAGFVFGVLGFCRNARLNKQLETLSQTYEDLQKNQTNQRPMDVVSMEKDVAQYEAYCDMLRFKLSNLPATEEEDAVLKTNVQLITDTWGTDVDADQLAELILIYYRCCVLDSMAIVSLSDQWDAGVSEITLEDGTIVIPRASLDALDIKCPESIVLY